MGYMMGLAYRDFVWISRSRHSNNFVKLNVQALIPQGVRMGLRRGSGVVSLRFEGNQCAGSIAIVLESTVDIKVQRSIERRRFVIILWSGFCDVLERENRACGISSELRYPTCARKTPKNTPILILTSLDGKSSKEQMDRGEPKVVRKRVHSWMSWDFNLYDSLRNGVQNAGEHETERGGET